MITHMRKEGEPGDKARYIHHPTTTTRLRIKWMNVVCVDTFCDQHVI